MIERRGVRKAVVIGWALAAIGAAMAAPAEAKQTPEEKQAARAAADYLAPSLMFANVGWAMGVSGDAFDSNNDAPGSEKLDLAPFVNVGVNFGSGSGWSADVMAIFANFGRLMNKADVAEFSERTSGTAVRRALITDFTVKAPLWARPGFALGLNVVNTGFIMDAQGETEEQNPLDAATYLFSGASLYFADGDDGLDNRAIADLLVGVSELLTGDEVFDFSEKAKPSLRVRPRMWLQFRNGFGAGRPLQLGFWADLGIDESEADALTAFVAVPLRTE
jgi:hypothetical protein